MSNGIEIEEFTDEEIAATQHIVEATDSEEFAVQQKWATGDTVAELVRSARNSWEISRQLYSGFKCKNIFLADINFRATYLKKRLSKKPGYSASQNAITAPYFVDIKSNLFCASFNGEEVRGNLFGLPICTANIVLAGPYANLDVAKLDQEGDAEYQFTFRPLPSENGLLYEEGSLAAWAKLGQVEKQLYRLTLDHPEIGSKNGINGVKQPWKNSVAFNGEPSLFCSRKVFRDAASEDLDLLRDPVWVKANCRTWYIAQNICLNPKKPVVPASTNWCMRVEPNGSLRPLNWKEIANIQSGDWMQPIVSPRLGFRRSGGSEFGPEWKLEFLIWLGRPSCFIGVDSSTAIREEAGKAQLASLGDTWKMMKKEEEKERKEALLKDKLRDFSQAALPRLALDDEKEEKVSNSVANGRKRAREQEEYDDEGGEYNPVRNYIQKTNRSLALD